jgi:hypothetical protein
MNNDETLLVALRNLVKPSQKEIKKLTKKNDIKKGSRRTSKQKDNQYKTFKNTQTIKFGLIIIIIILVLILITMINKEIRSATTNPKNTKTDTSMTDWLSFKNLLIVILVVCIIIIILSYYERFRPWLDNAIKTLAVVSLFYVSVTFFELNATSNLHPINQTFNALIILVVILFAIVSMQIIFTRPSSELYNLIVSSFNVY